MTISSTTRKAGPFTGNGTANTFPFAFKVFATTDVVVVKTTTATGVASALVMGTDYTVSLNADQNASPGGNVILTAGNLATGYTLALTSAVPELQPTDFTNQGGFYPAVLNQSLDRLTILNQQTQEQVDRSIKAPLGEGAIGALPAAADRANKTLTFDNDGNPVAVGTPVDVQAAVDTALAYRDTAVASALDAASNAAASLNARIFAEAARNAALTNAGLKLSIADGLNTTTSGQTFAVISGLYTIFYTNNAGSAQELGRQLGTVSLFNGYGVSTRGKVQAHAEALNTSDATLGWWDISTSYLFQDRFGKTPVTATGQNVGLIVPSNGQNGAEQISNNGFASSTGWTLNSWTVGSGTANSAAQLTALRWLGATYIAQRRYCVEFDAVITTNTLDVSIGAGTAVNISASGHYKIYPICGGAPAAGLNFTPNGSFTGSVDNVHSALAPVWLMFAPSDAERGTYQVDANHGPYVDLPAGKDMKTDGLFTMTSTAYMCLALGRDTPIALNMATFGAPGGGAINYQDESATTYALKIGSARSGQFALPSTRSGGFPLGAPIVADCYVEPGFTSCYVNGGERDVLEQVGLASGAKRKVANTFVGGDSWSGAFFGLNNTTGGSSAANTKFFGGTVYLGAVTLAQRRKVMDYFMTSSALDTLKDYEYDGFCFIGQSNMMGVGDQSTATAVTFGTGAEYIDSGYLRPVKCPTQHAVWAQVSLTGSLQPAFAAAYYAATGRRVCVIGSAYSGEGLVVGALSGGTWLGSKLPNYAGFKVKNCLRDVRCAFRGFVYLGGEQDVTHSHTQADYEGYLVQLRDKLRTACGIPDAPLLLMSIDDNATSPTQYALIRAAMANVVTYAEGIYLILPYQNWKAAGQLQGDGVHWTQTALNSSGTTAGTNAAALFLQ